MDRSPATVTYKDLLLGKLSYSVICSVLSQLVLLQVYIFFTNTNIFHPQQWIRSTFAVFASVSTWLYVIPFVSIIFAQSIICAKDYVLKQEYCSTRFQSFLSVLSIRNFVLLILNVVIGATLVWLFSSLGGGHYQSLTRNCNKLHYCLNEGSFMLIISGIWSGLYYFTKIYVSKKHLSFPVIHQRKLLQFKAQLVPLLKESIISSFWPTFYFVIIYMFWGESLADSFRNMFSLLKEKDCYIGIQAYFCMWIFAALYNFNMNLMQFFFNLFLTEPVEFPMQHVPNSLCLQECLNVSEWPIIQNLACYDLNNLALNSKSRRQVFFTLSQPGGHPHNWNHLVENVLKLFQEYTNQIDKSAVVTENMPKAALQPQNLFQHNYPAIKSAIKSPERYQNFRNMSLMYNTGLDEEITVEITRVPINWNLIQNLIDKIKQKVNSAISVIKILLGINFLFGELPQANIQTCLANGYVIIWASQGISDIVCASLVEDQYGIVQKDLPAIINTLVQLKHALDKLNKIPALTRKMAGYNDFNFKMKNAVNYAVRRSLFNICKTFGKYLNDLPLSKDTVFYLQTLYRV
ncbi:unnamed protein product [Acanthoscelides obtectus]|uniref:Nucleoporin Ndc1 n=1 Tax=Acanthoscelides obtectus TaxID=200917 RepID=A0A9P0PGZ9_ACAOB|nr:unnamed protein product [Acanthoscelides obtectus]CAK1647501.1 Nucleoporin Ndc1 [Acanthoscelides obtectus]